MQVFELLFNAPSRSDTQAQKQDIVFDSFCYEPENIYEKRIGALYLVGALKNVLPKNIRFLDNLAATIKENYYKIPNRSDSDIKILNRSDSKFRSKSIDLMTPEKSLKQSLKETNEYLEKIAKSGDISWLGNLSFAVLSVVPFQEKYQRAVFNLAKVGDLKILVLRDKQIIDIEQKLRLEDIEPYPLKIFNNIISGELIENDRLLILTKEVFETFCKQSLLDKIADITIFEEDKLLKILKIERNLLLKISGVCLLIVLSQQALPKKKIGIKPKILEFSFKQAFSRLYSKNLRFFSALRSLAYSMNALRSFRRFAPAYWRGAGLARTIKISKNTKQKIILILALIFLLVLGFFIF